MSIMRIVLLTLLATGLALCGHALRGQNTDPEPQKKSFVVPPSMIPDPEARQFVVPPSPVLSPSDEMKTFKVAPGYRIELVAAEPLVREPVAMAFDPEGRLWVCEMRSYMPDSYGTGQRSPVNTISVLEDTDGDGVMDKSTVFLDKLYLPRSVCWTIDGLLLAESGKIWLCKMDGIKFIERKAICSYQDGGSEHTLNGLMPGLDNWLYNAKEGLRLRKIGGNWVRESTVPRGQWGITQDDRGYLVYNVNAQLIRGDLVPCYSPSAHATNPLVNVQLFKDQVVWPIRPNTGINRGYLADFLRPDGTMKVANADCGPVIFRGDNLPKELVGDVFIPEPAGNLVRRQVFVDVGGVKSSKNAYDKTEFLASTDERFRPVNMANGPDGTLYIADMYRGVLQDYGSVTPYLRKEIVDRELEKGMGLGRIFRIVHESTQPRKAPALGKATGAELVANLDSPNGWRREMSQRLLVERGDASIVPALEKVVTAGPQPLGRLHALWTLEGLGKLDTELLLTAATTDKDADVRASAVSLLRADINRRADPTTLQELAPLAKDSDKNVRMQLAYTIGLVNSLAADRALEPILKEAATNPAFLEGILAGFSGRESEFLAARLALPNWAKAEPWRQKLLEANAGLMWRQRQPLTVLRFLHLVGGIPVEQSWQQVALLEGLTSKPLPKKTNIGKNAPKTPLLVKLPTVPEPLEKLRKSPDEKLAAAAEAMAKQLIWPGKDGKPLPVLPPLSAKHQALYDLGRKEYMALCAACHHPAGYGDAGKGPPLLDSEWLDFDERVIRLVLYGLRGPITVGDEPFNRDGALEMPGTAKALDDLKIAGILTFVRREMREQAPPVEPETVARIRAATADRADQWTEKELLQIK